MQDIVHSVPVTRCHVMVLASLVRFFKSCCLTLKPVVPRIKESTTILTLEVVLVYMLAQISIGGIITFTELAQAVDI